MKILLNTATHGDEKIGSRVASIVKGYALKNGRIVFKVANDRAFKLGKRFIDQDLNRSFPGKENGNYEERIAYKLSPLIKSVDIVFDIHSTTSLLRDAVIVTRLTKKTKELIDVISPKYVLIMNATKNNALISQAKIGIAFEYGKDESRMAIIKTAEGIRRSLIYLNLIEGKNREKKTKPIFFNVTKHVKKPNGYTLLKNIRNYSIIKKGQAYAEDIRGNKLIAKESFYPILFGEKKYKDYFGFSAEKLR